MQIISYILNFFKLSSLIVVIGSTITLGALMAPVIFKVLERSEAAKLMVDIFARYDAWLNIAVIILLVSYSIDLIFIQRLNWGIPQIITALGVVLISVLSFYLIYTLSPEIHEAFNNQAKNFRELHNTSEKIHKFNFLLGIIVLVCSFVI
ncbi:MAG: DUF4149 domain-containing protein [Candidatus Caenarcaniphilales bacterium]|nr:DUF4149 domain-containing protein [Candidatus Caenarcaniphilales bacterium]